MTIAFEDLHVGMRLAYGAKEVTEQEILDFAREFDPQPFHLDPAAAKASLLGGLAASGWHTCAMTMRMQYDGFLKDTTGVGAPGIDEARWLKPVRPGMVLGVRQEFTALRVSQSRPDLGLATMTTEVLDQTGLVVMTQRHTGIFVRRHPEAPIPAPVGEIAARRPRLPEPPRVEGEDLNRSRFAAYYEDVIVGARLTLGSHHFTREETTHFASRFDPQPFHLDDAAAAASHFGRLSASGWHTASIYMRLHVLTRDRIRLENLARGLPVAPNGPSPGIRDLRWLKPVFVGDTITYESTIMDKTPSSRPGWGRVTSRVTGVNQDGVRVFESHGASMVQMRGQ